MDLVYSFLKKSDRRCDNLNKMAAVSNFYAQKNGHNTILYTDLESYKLLEGVKFSEVRFFKQNTKNLPYQFWCGAKMFSMAEMNSPYIHIDFDLFILENKFLEKISEMDFFYLHDEPWVDKMLFGAMINDILSESISPWRPFKKNEFLCRNMALFGSTTYKGTEIIKSNAEKILEFVYRNAKMFDTVKTPNFLETFSLYAAEPGYEFMICVLIEQMLMTSLICDGLEKNKVTKIFDGISSPKMISIEHFKKSINYLNKYKIYHIWGAKSAFAPILDYLISYYNIKY
jgi:hypothetical protein